jgi:hypothetical protein
LAPGCAEEEQYILLHPPGEWLVLVSSMCDVAAAGAENFRRYPMTENNTDHYPGIYLLYVVLMFTALGIGAEIAALFLIK